MIYWNSDYVVKHNFWDLRNLVLNLDSFSNKSLIMADRFVRKGEKTSFFIKKV